MYSNVETIFFRVFFSFFLIWWNILIFFSANQNCRWWGSCNTKGQKQTTFAKARHNYRTIRRLFKLFRLSNWNWAVIQPPMCFQIWQIKVKFDYSYSLPSLYSLSQQPTQTKSNRSDAASSAVQWQDLLAQSILKKQACNRVHKVN